MKKVFLTILIWALTFNLLAQTCQYNFNDNSIMYNDTFNEIVFKEIDDVSCFDITFKINSYKGNSLIQNLMAIMDQSDFSNNYMQLGVINDEIFIWNNGVTEYMFIASTIDANLQLDTWYRVQWTTDKKRTIVYVDGDEKTLHYTNQYSAHKWIHNLASFSSVSDPVFFSTHNVHYLSLGAWVSDFSPNLQETLDGSIKKFRILNRGPDGVQQDPNLGVTAGKPIMPCVIKYKFDEGQGNVLNDFKPLGFDLTIEGGGSWECN